MAKYRGPDRDDAVSIAFLALAFLAEDRTRLQRFLDVTGMDADTLRAQAQDPSLLSAILDYLMQDEALLLMFTANAGLPPEDVEPAAMLLRQTG